MALLLRDGSPSGVSMVSQLPWSARMKRPTPAWSHREAARSAKAASARGKGRGRRGREVALDDEGARAAADIAESWRGHLGARVADLADAHVRVCRCLYGLVHHARVAHLHKE